MRSEETRLTRVNNFTFTLVVMCWLVWFQCSLVWMELGYCSFEGVSIIDFSTLETGVRMTLIETD